MSQFWKSHLKRKQKLRLNQSESRQIGGKVTEQNKINSQIYIHKKWKIQDHNILHHSTSIWTKY